MGGVGSWVKLIKNLYVSQKSDYRNKLNEIQSLGKISKFVYNKYMETQYIVPLHTFNKWNNELNLTLDEFFWMDACEDIKLNSSSSSTRAFQIRFLNRTLATNYSLVKNENSE